MAMRRFQMMIEPELYAALERQAVEEGLGVSVAELLRRYARERVQAPPHLHEDPLWQMVGADDGAGPDDAYQGSESEHVDEILYGRRDPR